MKYYKCLIVRREGLNAAALSDLLRIWPSLADGGGFRHESSLECPPGDEETAELVEDLLQVLARHGIRESPGWAPATYHYHVNRHYEDEDLAAAEYLLIRAHPREIQHEHERDTLGRPLLIASKAKSSLKIGCIWPNDIIVSNQVRGWLEEASFAGLRLGEVVLKGKSIYAAQEPFWELTSSIVLPRMPNPERFFHVGGASPEAFAGDYSRVVVKFDPPFRNAEVHYRRRDLAKAGTFDIARTFEKYLHPHGCLVVSRRFFSFFREHKLPLNVEPVRVEGD